MKRIISLILTVAMLLSIVPLTVFAETADPDRHPFGDVSAEEWYEEYVQYVWNNGLFNGITTSTFAPERAMTRAMFVTVLGRIADVQQDDYTEQVFSDVEPKSWYGAYVAWAAEKEITNGIGDGKFAPDREVSREEMATFVYRYLNSTGELTEQGEMQYPDKDTIADFAVEAVGACTAIGIFEGDEQGLFNPQDSSTRAEAAAVFTRLHKYLEENSETRYYKVTFALSDKLDEGVKDSITMEQSVMVEKNSLLYTLPLPEAKGYVFVGWFYDEDLTRLAATTETVTSDLTLYPKMVAQDAAEEELWPTYALNYITSQDVAPDFTLQVQANSEEQIRENLTFKAFSEQDGEIEYDIVDEGNGIFTLKPVGGLRAGGSYQVIANDREQEPVFDDEGNMVEQDYVLFLSGEEVLPSAIQYHNITVAIQEHNTMRIDNAVIFLPYEQVSGIVLEEAMLYTMSEDGFEINDKTDTFTYNGDALSVGDVVAIYDGILDEETREVDGELAYVKITGINGNTYTYGMPGIQEVLFTSLTLPIPMDDPDTEEVDGAFFNEDGTLTVYNEYLDFSAFAVYEELALNGETVAEVGDYLALYTGSLEAPESYAYYKITDMRDGGSSAITTFTLVEQEEIEGASLYEVYAGDIGITREALDELEAEAKKQAIESGFADQAAHYLAEALLRGEELGDAFAGYSLEDIKIVNTRGGDDPWYDGGEWNPEVGEDQSLTIEAGAIEAGVGTLMVEVGRVDVHVSSSRTLEEITAMSQGLRLELGLTFTVQIGTYLVGTGWADCVSLQVSASFVQEVAFRPLAEFREIKGKILGFIPYTKEYQVKVGVDIGTYVGVGATFTVISADDFDSAFPWVEAIKQLDPNYDPAFPNVDSIARQIRNMMGDETTFALGNGEESLVSIYQDLLEKEIDYVEILAIRCPGCPIKIGLPYKIGQITINLELVISAKMSVTVGMAMETLSVRRYEFNAWVNIVKFKAGYSTNSFDLQTPYSEMNLYLMGNIGLRIGPRISISVGLLAVGKKNKALANAGFSVYFGYTVDMYGIFFSHLRVEDGRVTDASRCIGALEAKHGIFLDLDFHLGVIFDIISVDIHALDLTYNIVDKKGQPKVFEATQRTHEVKMWNTTPYRIDNNLLTLNTLVVKTGKLSRKGASHQDFHVELSNPLFHYHAKDGSITVTDPGDSIKEVCEVRLTYRGSDTLFIVTPITITIQLTWEKTWPTYFVRFYGRTSYYNEEYHAITWDQPVAEYRFVAGETITGIVPPVREIAGYDFLGWYYMDNSLEGVKNNTLLSDLNNLEGYLMPYSDINIAPLYKARDDTPYTLHYYVETVAGTGAYELYKTATHTGTTDAYVPAYGLKLRTDEDLGKMDGFKFRYDLLPMDESNRILGYVKLHGDGSGSGDIYLSRETYAVFYHTNNSDYKGVSTVRTSGVYGAPLTAEPDLSDVPGWSFTGWTDSEGNAVEIPDTIPSDTGKGGFYLDGTYYAGGTHYIAQWEPSFNYYTVNHYLKNPDGGYDLIESQVGSDSNPAYGGYTGDYIPVSDYIKTIEEAQLSHYVCTTSDGIDTTRISGVPGTGAGDKQHNGQVLNLYYDRDYIRVFWESADGELLQYYHTGQTIVAPEGLRAEEKVGYIIDGWKNTVAEAFNETEIYREGGELKMGKMYKRFVPNYIPAQDTKYTVIHKRPAAGTHGDYSDERLWETVVGYATTDSIITAEVRHYDGFVTPKPEQLYIRADGSSELVYEYRRQDYDLTLDFNGGWEVPYAHNYYYGIPFKLPLNVTRDGYEFKGWLLTTEGYTANMDAYYGYVDGSCLTSMQALTFVAQWEAVPIHYTVEHYLQNLDGSYGDPRIITLTSMIDTAVTAEPSEFVGFTFDADNALNVTTGTISDSKGTIVDADGNVTALRLYYSRNSYTVTWYDYDGSELGSAEVLYGAEITLPELATPQRTGYRFAGWKNFGTMGTSDVRFYAATDGTWEANRYTVRFNANGGTGSMEDQSFVYGTAQNLSANTFQYTNRNFMGWSTTPDGEVEYTNNQSVSDLTAEDGAVVTLYAVWELMEGATAQYTIAHYIETLAGGYEKHSETTGYGLIEQERTLSAADAIRIVGFSFDPDAANVLTAIVKEDGSTLFELYYSRNRYDLTLDFGDEQIKVAVEDEDYIRHIVTKEEDPVRARADEVISVRYGEDLSAYLSDLENEIGYTFAGWDNSLTTMPAEDMLVTAQWEPVEVTVTFHPGVNWFYPTDVDLDAAAVTMTYRYGEEVTVPEGLVEQFIAMQESPVTEVGWVFGTYQGNYPTLAHFPLLLVEGYYLEQLVLREYALDEEGNYLYDENGDYVYTDTYAITVAPFWAAGYDEVHFDANGGEGTMESMKVYDQGYRELPKCSFTREGYVFVGWNTASDGSGTAYGIYDFFYGKGGDTTTTLFAQWEKIQ